MEQAYELSVRTHGGVCDLGRVVGVLALMDLTPRALASGAVGGGLRIDMRIVSDARSCELCVSRLRALVCVASAWLTPNKPGATAKAFAGASGG